MNVTIGLLLFLGVFAAAAFAASATWNVSEKKRKKHLDKRLHRSLEQLPEDEPSLLKKSPYSNVPLLGILLEQFAFTRVMQKQIQQADLKWSVGRLVALMLVCGFVALNIVVRISAVPAYMYPLCVGLVGFIPYAYVLNKRTRRLAAFEEQFPEALDFLGRALRAGHGFSVSLEMLAEESPQPLAMEIQRTFDEQNLGLPLEVALQNLSERISLLDVRFFVSAVQLQNRTGGNLSEILDKLAYVIRERFKLKGQVRACSAHGRLTGKVLTVMPMVVVVLMMMVNPKYLMVLFKSPYGKHLVAAAIFFQFLAYLIIRKIVNIKV